MNVEKETLDWHEHIRLRPGMYTGKLGDGSLPDDGVYVLIKEILDNSVDEYMAGYGKYIELNIDESSKTISVRDYGRGIPPDRIFDAATKMYAGSKSNSRSFKKSIGIAPGGTGLKVVNAMSGHFFIQSFRDKRAKAITFAKGQLVADADETDADQPDGTLVTFIPDETLFGNYRIMPGYLIQMLKNYAFLNTGLTVIYNGDKYVSYNGLCDLLDDKMKSRGLYPPVHLKGEDIELAICHDSIRDEEYYSFVNGLFTRGGTHLKAFREAYVKTIREFFRKDYDASGICSFLTAAISIKIQEPLFESANRVMFGSGRMYPDSDLTVREFITGFVQRNLSDFLHRHPDVAAIIKEKLPD